MALAIQKSRTPSVKGRLLSTLIMAFALMLQPMYGVVAGQVASATPATFSASATCVDSKAVVTLTTKQAELPGVPEEARNWHAAVTYRTEDYGHKTQTLSEGDVDSWTVNTDAYNIDKANVSATVVGGYTLREDIIVSGRKVGSWDRPVAYARTLQAETPAIRCDTVAPIVKINLDRQKYVSTGAFVSKSRNPEIEASDDNELSRIELFKGSATTPSNTWDANGSKSRRAKIDFLADGKYTIKAYDAAGNESSAFVVNIDSTSPQTTLHAPDKLAGNIFTVSGEASDNMALNRVYVQLVHRETGARFGGTTINLIPQGVGPYTWNRTFDATELNLPEGAYAAHVEVVDMAGNRASEGWSDNFTLDKTMPSFEITSPVNGSTVNGTQRMAVRITDANDIKKVLLNVGDGHGNYVWEQGKTNNKVTRDDDSDTFYIDIDTKTLADDVNHIVVRATDGAGNTRYWNNNANSRQHVFYVDRTAPKISNVKFDKMVDIDGVDHTGAKLNNGFLNITFTTDEPLKLVGSQVGLSVPGLSGVPSTGWTKVELVSADENKYRARISLVDRTDTNIPGYEGFFNDKTFKDVKLYFRTVDELNNTDSVYYYPDGSFGKSPSAAYTFTIDNVAPELINVTSDGSDIDGQILGGEHDFKVNFAQDDLAKAYVEYMKLEWTESKDEFEYKKKLGQLFKDEAHPVLSVDTQNWEDGKYRIKVTQIVDKTGNTAQTYTVDFIVDNTAPKIHIVNMLNGQSKNKVDLNGKTVNIDLLPGKDFRILTDEDGVLEVTFPDGTQKTLTANQSKNNQSIAWALRDRDGEYQNGAHTFVKIDVAGNRSNPVTVSFDTIAPDAQIVTPGIDGEAVRGVVTVVGEASGDDLKSHWFEITGPNSYTEYSYDMNASSDTYSFEWDTAGLEDGEYRIRYVATDKVGNRNDSVTPAYRFVVVDNTKPTLSTSMSSVSINKDTDDAPEVTIVAQDGLTGIDYVQYKIMNLDESTALDWVTINNDEATLAPAILGLDAGEYILRARAYDKAGNKRSGSDVAFTVSEVAVNDGDEDEEDIGGGDIDDGFNQGHLVDEDAPTRARTQTLTEQIFTDPIVAFGNQGVLGDQDEADTEPVADSDNSDNVLGEQDDNGTRLTDTAAFGSDSKLLGMAWYWWLAILAALVGGWLLVAAAIRRGREEEA